MKEKEINEEKEIKKEENNQYRTKTVDKIYVFPNSPPFQMISFGDGNIICLCL